MARKIYRGYARDGNGTVLSGATVSVYLTGTSTVASIYAASSGGTAVNSTTTDSTGLYSFYVDYSDYAAGTQFRLTISKTGYDSVTYDEVECLPPTFSTDGTLTDNSDADFPSEKAVKTYVDAIGAWTDYSASSTVVGWAATPTREILYCKVGKIVFVSFYITGTSNATGASFTLPDTASGFHGAACRVKDNGSWLETPGWIDITGAATVSISVNCGDGSVVFTSSGAKVVHGTFAYGIA